MNITSQDLREHVLKMAGLVEASIQGSLSLEKSMQEIFDLEKKINDYHILIDDACFKYIALKSPTAKDLRTALAIIKINTDLERMGDEAIKIKRSLLMLEKEIPILNNMGIEVIMMVKDALDSFSTGNIKMATNVIIHDEDINSLNRDIARTYINKIKNNDVSFDEGHSILRISKNLERIGDHAKNVAEDVIFLVSGSDIRHNQEFKTKKEETKKEDNKE